jgi:hypothetical protein
MNIHKVIYIPEAEMEFTESDVKHLMEASAKHYDGVCKRQGTQGGLIYGMQNAIAVKMRSPVDFKPTIRMNMGEIDLLMKVCEMGVPNALYASLLSSFKKLTEEYDRLNPRD